MATVAGSLASWAIASDLVQQFSGKGLVPDAVARAPLFILSVSAGAAVAVVLATRLGFPVSTTHALIGGLVGAGMAQEGGQVHLTQLTSTFVLPLLVSPLLAAVLGLAAHRLMKLRPARNDRACVVAPQVLLIAAHLVNTGASVALMAVAMAIGGLVFASKVAETLSQRVARMDHTQGLAANLITAGLVLFASKLGLPVSTTHVAVGAIGGVGASAGALDRRALRNILLSWIATLPVAACAAWLVSRLG